MQIWRAIPGYEGYYSASDSGLIRSEDRLVPHVRDGKRLKGRIIRHRINKQNGYPCVNLMRLSIEKTFPVHVLVALAFIGPRPAGMEVAHFDGDRMNPAASNLRYATPKENRDDSRRHGTLAKGERLPQSKLTEKQVVLIRADLRMQKEIAEEFGVSVTTISQVKSRKQWAHVG
jgi:hypothetical protein